MPVLLPAIPAEIDQNPAPVGQLPDGSMGAITVDSGLLTQAYGVLAVRFNTLREFYGCVRAQVNEHKAPADCTK